MTEPSLFQRLVARVIPERFIPKRRKSLRSPRRTMRLLKWANETNRPVAYTFILGWAKLLSTAVLAYFLLTAPDKPGLSPLLSDINKGVLIFLSFANFVEVGWRTAKSWRVRQRRQRRRQLKALDVQLSEAQAMLS